MSTEEEINPIPVINKDIFLDSNQIWRLTGYRAGSYQKKALLKMGLKHYVNSKDEIVLLLEDAIQFLSDNEEIK